MMKGVKTFLIGQLIEKIHPHPYLMVAIDEPICDLSKRIAQVEDLRNIYVVDQDKRLIGYVSLGRLIRYLTATRRKTDFHYHALLEYVSCETVMDLMEEDVVYAQLDDEAEHILDIMIERGIKHVPVVDEKRHIVSNISIFDVWRITEEGTNHAP